MSESEPGSGPATAGERLLRISQQPQDGAVVVTAAGEIDAHTVREFTAALDETARSGARRVVINLLETTFIDSAGLAALVEATLRAQQHGDPPPVVVPPPVLLRTIQITGLDHVLTIRHSIDEALTR